MRIRACAFALLALSAPAIAFAPNVVAQASSEADPFTDMARQRFQEGVRLFDQGKFEEARAAFLQAYALKKHPAVLLNLAQSELRSNHPVEAARHFAEFLRDNPNAEPAERKAAADGLTVARTKTARVHVVVDVDGADVFVDGEFIGRTPLPEPIDVAPGDRKVEVRAAGHQPRLVNVSASMDRVEPLNIAFGVPKTTAPPTDTPPAEQEGYVLSSEGRQPFVEWFMQDKVAWATGGTTVVGLGFGIAFAIFANNAANNASTIRGQIKVVAERDPGLENYEGYDRRSNPCADPIPVTKDTNYAPACDQLRDNLDARDLDKTLMTVGFVVAGLGAAGTGVAYYLRSKPAESDAAASRPKASERTTVVAPLFTPQVQGLAIGGTF